MSPMCMRIHSDMYVSSTVAKLKVIVVVVILACIVCIDALL